MPSHFQLLKTDAAAKARRGILKTAHGEIQTPFFMPVGTNGTVKTLSSEDLLEMNSQIVLSNTYHLFIRPGTEVIQNAGGLHGFMNWNKPILTDSGGYQVFSLAKLRKLSDEGVQFQSHFDGQTHFFSPEDVIGIEQIFGSDIMMPLDVCAPYPCERPAAQEALRQTIAWAKRSKEFYFNQDLAEKRQLLFGIIQGASFKDLREQAARATCAIRFDGYAVGGVSVGEPETLMFETLQWVEPFMPQDHPRYFMGIGYPDQIVRAVAQGMDMFDTCIPTRFARHGNAFTDEGRLAMRNAEYIKDLNPLDEDCGCNVCQKYSRSYIRHLLNSGEILGLKLLAYHNVYFYIHLMERMRRAIEQETFKQFHDKFLNKFKPNAQGPI